MDRGPGEELARDDPALEVQLEYVREMTGTDLMADLAVDVSVREAPPRRGARRPGGAGHGLCVTDSGGVPQEVLGFAART